MTTRSYDPSKARSRWERLAGLSTSDKEFDDL